MLSRKEVRPKQTSCLHSLGFLPVSIDYRLCPEVSLSDGPMEDAVSALVWVRETLPSLRLLSPTIKLDPSRVVVVGWSTGGHLAMTMAFTSLSRSIAPPTAILSFYCPTDYEDPCWSQPNFPESSSDLAKAQDPNYDPRESVQPQAITSYTVPGGAAQGGWYATHDPRSRLVLHMNWKGQCLPVLINGLPKIFEGASKDWANQPQPELNRIKAVSPYAQIVAGNYNVPTCIVHGDQDDLIPWQQSVRAGDALRSRGVDTQVLIIKGKKHLFDLYRDNDGKGAEAIEKAYAFLGRHCFGSERV